MGEPLALQSCTAGPQPALLAQVPPGQPPPQPPPQPPSQTPSQTPPPASQREPDQSQREITAEMIVAHLQSQGEAGIASAHNILKCDHASDAARRAAALVVEAAAQHAHEHAAHGAPALSDPPRMELPAA